MQQVDVTPQLLTASGADCKRTAGQIEIELARLRSYVVDLQEKWHGISAVSFVMLMHQFDRAGKNLNLAIEGIGTGLELNAVNYVESEVTSDRGITEIQHSIPPARI